MDNVKVHIQQNLKSLTQNSYPGRGMIIGLTPDRKHAVQVYWIMGRSENSKNRVFIEENGFVRTEAYDVSKLVDPSLIIYSPIKFHKNLHVISNGDQTETIMDALQSDMSFEDALNKREFEPDPPNFTPRISGLIDVGSSSCSYKLSILKSVNNNPEYCIRNFFNYERAISGVGHCITTYAGDGNPVPSYTGEPFIVELFNDRDETLNYYWDVLNEENKVAILIKFINIETKESTISIRNKYCKE